MLDAFHYVRRAAFSDTDAMGVIHHANYLRYCEEARVSWMRSRGLIHTHYPNADRVLALLHYQVWHLATATFDDELKIFLQVHQKGLRIHFQYAIYKGNERICEAETLHVVVDSKLKPLRPHRDLTAILEKEKWTETWLSNS